MMNKFILKAHENKILFKKPSMGLEKFIQKAVKEVRRNSTDHHERRSLSETMSSSPCSSSIFLSSKPSKHQFASEKAKSAMSLDHFIIIKLVGAGAYGKVFLVVNKLNMDFYAMKAMRKDTLLEEEGEVKCAWLERDVYVLANECRFLTKMFCSFQSEVLAAK